MKMTLRICRVKEVRRALYSIGYKKGDRVHVVWTLDPDIAFVRVNGTEIGIWDFRTHTFID